VLFLFVRPSFSDFLCIFWILTVICGMCINWALLGFVCLAYCTLHPELWLYKSQKLRPMGWWRGGANSAEYEFVVR
jgi:hypothetical protein